ncbi:APC family permease [Mycolicibacterium sp. 141076]|uniref:APC family permease n=2 Tax=Mycobacteriaceae TaxID=1762 RepID=UPI00299DA886|nr:APC family permease [Mycolicibacterium sp. 141076]MDX1876640.1 APC family permease [Mycolicibacterium sp. 141076]
MAETAGFLYSAMLTDNQVPLHGLGPRTRLGGLDRGALGAADVAAQSVSAMAPCGAAAAIPLLVAAQGGPVVLSMAIAFALALVVSWLVRGFARRVPAAGSLYTCAAVGVGPLSGFVTAGALLLGYLGIGMFAVTETSAFWLRLVSAVGMTAHGWMVAVAALGFAALSGVVLVRGIRISARVSLVTETVAVLLVVAVAVWLLCHGDERRLHDAVLAHTPDLGRLASGVAVAMTAFVGFESATVLAVETRNPLRTVPAAVRGSLLVGGAVVLLATLAQAETLSGTTPNSWFQALNADPGGRALVPAMYLAAALSFFACALASTTAAARVLLSLAREGVLPAALGHTDLRSKAPTVGIWLCTATVFGVPFAVSAFGADAEAVCGSLVAGAVCGFLLAYAALAGAMPAMLRRLGEPSRVAWVVGPACALVLTAVLAGFWGLTVTGPLWAGAVTSAVWMGAWTAIGLRVRARRPDAFASMGAHAGTVRSSVWRGYLRGTS